MLSIFDFAMLVENQISNFCIKQILWFPVFRFKEKVKVERKKNEETQIYKFGTKLGFHVLMRKHDSVGLTRKQTL